MEPRPAPREALEALQRELASRDSVLHFAHAAVSTILALIAAGAAAKIAWDLSAKEVDFLVPALVTSALCFVYAVVRYLMGHRALKRELASFAQLKSLRRELNLEDPSQLLPR